MENVNGYDEWGQIMNELLEGHESAKVLRNQLHEQTNGSLSSDEHQAPKCSLMEKLMNSFQKIIELAEQISVERSRGADQHGQHLPSNPSTHFQSESPSSLVLSSPRSENTHPDLRPSKRRKTMPRWTKMVQVSQDKSGAGLEGPLDDGFSWRKYGQKDILAAKFPRGYYRCTHRHSKGCTATKQVQRSDEDQTIYQVMYRGEHTCHTGPKLDKAQHKPPSTHTKTEEQSPPNTQDQSLLSPQEYQSVHKEVFVGLGPYGDLKVELEETQTKAQLFRCFSFTTALLEPEPIDNFLGCSAYFASSPISESNYFPVSSYHIAGPHVVLNVQTSESVTSYPISGPNSVTNSPTMVDFEFPLEQLVELDPNLF